MAFVKLYQRRLIWIITIISLTSLNCKKSLEKVSLFWGTINTTKNISLGEPIISKVQIEYSTTSFPLNFQGFQISEGKGRHFTIAAYAILTSHGESVANTELWTMDTTCVIHPTVAGQYILDFTYSGTVNHADTVIVQ